MNGQEQLLEEYKGELAELEKAYHIFTDVIGNHVNTTNIVILIQNELISLSVKINQLQEEIDSNSSQFDGEKEFDKYKKLNY